MTRNLQAFIGFMVGLACGWIIARQFRVYVHWCPERQISPFMGYMVGAGDRSIVLWIGRIEFVALNFRWLADRLDP